MSKARCLYGTVAVVLLFNGSLAFAEPADSAKLPGRQVKVATIPIGMGGDHDQKVKLATFLQLEAAGTSGVDIACLPEEFAGTNAEPIAGPTTKVIGELAKKHHMYVVCPIREQAPDGRRYNTAVLLDREGSVAGYYRKVFVFWGEGLNVSNEGVKVFDTDFGRIAMLTCFDANYDELWADAEHKGAELVLWPSAYGGGMPLNGYAMIHNYYIAAVGQGNMIDVFGKTIDNAESPRKDLFTATLDLDLTIVHKDFTGEKVDKLLREHKGEVERVPNIGDMENWYVLRSVKPGVLVRDLCKKYQIETLREYRQQPHEIDCRAEPRAKRCNRSLVLKKGTGSSRWCRMNGKLRCLLGASPLFQQAATRGYPWPIRPIDLQAPQLAGISCESRAGRLPPLPRAAVRWRELPAPPTLSPQRPRFAADRGVQQVLSGAEARLR